MIPVESVTITLGEYGVFFCQILGNFRDLRIRINGGVQETDLDDHDRGYFISLDNSTTDKTLTVQKINITIKGTESNNNSIVECYDVDIGRNNAPNATLIIKGTNQTLIIIYY